MLLSDFSGEEIVLSTYYTLGMAYSPRHVRVGVVDTCFLLINKVVVYVFGPLGIYLAPLGYICIYGSTRIYIYIYITYMYICILLYIYIYTLLARPGRE